MPNKFFKESYLSKLKYLKEFIKSGTFIFLTFLFASYIRDPQMKMFNAKDICGKWWMGQLKTEDAYKKLNLKSNGEILDYCVHFR